jgi:tRNA(fMet)-specific endonuclease VapC
LIAAERSGSGWDAVVGPEDDVAIAAITAAELLLGVELSDARHRKRRQRFVEGVLSLVGIEDYDLAAARAHARLLAHARRARRPRGAHDLIIAATAVSCRRIVVTADPAGFADLPDVLLRSKR